MKILFIHHRYHTNLFNWFRGFQQNGHNVKLLVYKPDEVNLKDLPKSTYLPPSERSLRKMKNNPRTRGDGVDRFSPYYYPSFKSVYEYFKSERPDLVIIRPAFSRFAYLVLICSILFGTKKVFYSQIRIHKHYTTLKKIAFKLTMSILNAYWISPCPGEKDRFAKASNRMLYFPFAMPVLKANEGFQHSEGKVKILCIAKYFRSKNPKLLLQVFLPLCDEFDHIYLTICGTGDEMGNYFLQMKEILEASPHKNKVKLLVNRPYNEVQEMYDSHDLFVLPSRHDPAAITNLEAMAHGLPVICSKSNGTAQYTEHGQSGYLFNVEDIDELEQYLREMVVNPGRALEMGKQSLLRVLEFHDSAYLTKEFLNSIS